MNPIATFIQLPSAAMQHIYDTVKQVESSNIPIFITGETGVGKETIARYIHQNSPRAEKPFVAINCDRFSPELLQSELFGHEAGAFTSATRQRHGALEVAHGGVLFLEDAPEMPADIQKMLLRVLDTATFTRLGGNEVLSVDVQIITATNIDIANTLSVGNFRQDLYYCLNGLQLNLPPLRERKEDIPPLVETFIAEFSEQYGKTVRSITPEALTQLENAAWLGNIRELRSCVQRAVALATSNTLQYTDFPEIYPAHIQTLSAIWHELPLKIQQAICQTLPLDMQHALGYDISTQIPAQTQDTLTPDTLRERRDSEWLNIENMNLQHILRAVAQKRIRKHNSPRAAADSLNIDVRTLQRYVHWEKSKT